MTQELVIVGQKPAEIVMGGRDAAKELTKIVSSRKKKLIMGGKQYLFFEDWQTIGKFYGVTAKVTHTEEIKEGDTLIGFMAQAVAVISDIEISAADAECTKDEPNWKNKPRFQLRSMAQTRACAKALRNCLGWVAVLAGYEPTPAEEMSDIKPEHGLEVKTTPKPTAQKADTPAPNIEQAERDSRELSPPGGSEGLSAEEPKGEIPKTQEQLFNYVAKHAGHKDTKFTKAFLINKFKIPEKRINEDILSVYYEVKALKDWPEYDGE